MKTMKSGLALRGVHRRDRFLQGPVRLGVGRPAESPVRCRRAGGRRNPRLPSCRPGPGRSPVVPSRGPRRPAPAASRAPVDRCACVAAPLSLRGVGSETRGAGRGIPSGRWNKARSPGVVTFSGRRFQRIRAVRSTARRGGAPSGPDAGAKRGGRAGRGPGLVPPRLPALPWLLRGQPACLAPVHRPERELHPLAEARCGRARGGGASAWRPSRTRPPPPRRGCSRPVMRRWCTPRWTGSHGCTARCWCCERWRSAATGRSPSILGVPIGTVMSRLSRARAQLVRELVGDPRSRN